ncbi:DUF3921 family protein [Bacillus sp. AK128]
MLSDPLDFTRITKAIEDTNKLFEADMNSDNAVNGAIVEAQDHLRDAISHAMSVDKKYLKYTNS